MPGPAIDFIVPTKYAVYQAVPAVLTSLISDEVMMPTGWFANDHATDIAVLRITDGAGLPIMPDVNIMPKSTWPMESNLSMFTGLQWRALGGTLYGGLVGYPTV